MSLLIRNGEIVTATDRYVADIYCEGETITQIGRNLSAPPNTEVIDATGKYVFPGFIDPHTHIYLPFMGTFAKDDYTSASQAALVGGTTTIIEMVCPSRKEEPLEAFELWKSKGDGKSACDFTFHMGVTRYDAAAESQLREIVKRGISSFKIFLAYKGAFGIDDTELWNTLKLAKSLGVITTAHCENDTAVLERQKELLAAGKTGPAFHHESRPPLVEAEGTHHLMTFAAMHDAHVYVVHLSCEESLAAAMAARFRGVNVWVETLIQYLLLDKTYAERENFEGAKYVMSPPLRDKRNQKILWDGLASGLISTLATDHAPFDFATQKIMGRDDFTKIPNGIPSIEDRVNLFYTHGPAEDRVSLHRFVDAASTQAAKLFGLFPRKGTIALGSDADLVIYDPKYRGKLSVKTQRQNVDYNAFEGMEITGRPSVVTVRGKIAVRDGQFVGDATRGKFVAREPNHF
ncbi:MAG TPA: dihydropyrimidinase [Phycisphaerae bacterium]|nr:dihydropyrimidinase [Phycisphaerae bacterium]